MLNQEQQIFEQIKKANNILITFSHVWNGDSVASALALFLFLKKIGKSVEIVAEEPRNNAARPTANKLFSFLPAFSEIKNELENLRKFIISLDVTNAKVSQIKYKLEKNCLNFIISPKEGFFTEDDITSSTGGFKYDLIIVLDAPDLESLGKIYDNDTEFFYKTSIVNIDHHSDNEEFGQINFIELNAVSVSEILFSLFESYSRELIDEDIATCLLAGIIYKTRSFKTPNITPHTLNSTSELISMGARREEIVNMLYRSRTLNVLKLWGRVLARLSGSLDNVLVWSTLSHIDFLKTEAGEEDLDEVIDELIVNIPMAKIIAIIYEKIPENNIAENEISSVNSEPLSETNGMNNQKFNYPTTSLVVYSVKNIDSMELIKEYNPTGDRRLARAEIDKPLTTAEKEIIELIEEKLRKLPL
ncbi:MAG: DHH family phosphoesterase [Patescibacteria group bacterium]|nr:DHH family phosphoesterase [Patescibacteria group bacterium]